MKKSQGKFILFDVTEFSDWLNSINVSREIKRIQNHHTWNPSYHNFNDSSHFNLLKGMENSHLERGFSDIAQNLTTFPDGTVAACRSLDIIPAGIKGANRGGICIEHVGNFDLNKDVMTHDHKTAIIKINALLCRKFNLSPNPDTLVYHHWYDLNTGERKNGAGVTKSCPGSNFMGGNKVSDAQTNFIPFIVTALKTADRIQPILAKEIIFKAMVTADALNVRLLPNASAKKAKLLRKRIIVNAFEMSGNWCRIDPHESYWVNSRYLEKISG